MTFDPNLPQSTDRPSSSQADLLNNFTQLNTVFNEDHVTFNAASDRGEHNKITLNSTIADPGLADPKCSVYTKTVAGDSELFFEKFDNGAAANLVQQMTNLNITNLGNAGTAGGTLYRIDLPVGITVYSGQTNAFSGNRTVVFPANYTTIYTATVSANDVNVQRISVTDGVGGLTIYTENNILTNWLAIGTI